MSNRHTQDYTIIILSLVALIEDKVGQRWAIDETVKFCKMSAQIVKEEGYELFVISGARMLPTLGYSIGTSELDSWLN